jgi:hypothetical protein
MEVKSFTEHILHQETEFYLLRILIVMVKYE